MTADCRSGEIFPARIVFESTMEEKVSVHMRLLEMNGTVAKRKWIPLAIGPLGGLALWLFTGGGASGRLMLAVMFTGLFSLIHLALYRRDLEREVRRALVRAMGGSGPTPAEYEISGRGITYRSTGMEVTFSWASVVTLEEDAEALEYVVTPTGLCRVPKRIFVDRSQMAAWLDQSRRMMEEARAAENGLD